MFSLLENLVHIISTVTTVVIFITVEIIPELFENIGRVLELLTIPTSKWSILIKS